MSHRRPDRALLVCLAGSVVAHFAIARGLAWLPERAAPVVPQRVTISVIEPPPPPKEAPLPPPPPPEPEPVKPVEPMKPVEPQKPTQVSAPHVNARPTVAPVANAPPVDHPTFEATGTDEPVYGVTMESTSQQGTGPVVQTGNTVSHGGTPTQAPVGSKPAGGPAPVAAYEATKLPIPQGRCSGTYTDEARASGDEGTVVLDLTVDEKGRARDVSVVSGLPHGLSAAALAAARACQFSPGEKDGAPVAVRIKGFKITFMLSESR